MKKKELKKENKKLKKELQIYKDICQKIIKITNSLDENAEIKDNNRSIIIEPHPINKREDLKGFPITCKCDKNV
jgi:cell division septum initiation protein DivIVA